MKPVRLMTAATLIGLPGVFAGARIFPLRWERITVCVTILLLSWAWLLVIGANDSVRELPRQRSSAAEDVPRTDP